MVRILRCYPKKSVRHWRAIERHPACGYAGPLLTPEQIAGPYVLLADITRPLLPARDRGSASN